MRLEEYLMSKATTLEELQINCRYFQLDANTEDFYVDTAKGRGTDCIATMERFLQPIGGLYQRILYIGHRGVGKSTDLYMLQQRVADIYEVANIRVMDIWGSNMLAFSDFLCILYKQLLSKYKYNLTDFTRHECEEATRLWSAVTEVEQVHERNAEQKINAEAGIGIKHLLKLVASAESTLNFKSESSEHITYTIQSSMVDYIIALNALVEAIEKSIGKPLLVVVEGIELLAFNRETDIFLNHGNFMQQIKLRMVITAPVALRYRPEFATLTENLFLTVDCPMLSVIGGDKKRNAGRIELLKQIIFKRVDESLIEDKALHTAVLLSGGVLRDLFLILSIASAYSLLMRENCITVESVYAAFRNYRHDKFARILAVGDYSSLLLKVLNNSFSIGFDDGLIDLLQNQFVLECTDTMCKVIHPGVLACLVEAGVVSEEQFESYVGVPFDM